MDDLEAFALLAPDATLARRDWRGVSFVRYCEIVGLTLTPGQRALALVAFDGLEPRDLPTELRDLGRQIFGPVDTIPPGARRVLALVAGARGGKSYVFSAHRTIHLALTVDLSSLAPGEHAYGAIVAPNPQQRDQCFAFVLGALGHPSLAPNVDGAPRADDVTLLRADGRRVTIEAIPAKRGGGALRGRWHTSVALEESAFFLDSKFVVNDQDIFDAAFPRILPGGQLLMPSTPWAEMGVLYRLFTSNHPTPWCAAKHLRQPGTPGAALAAHAPTLTLKDDALNRETVAAAYAYDRTNADREYGAQFLPVGSAQYFDPAAIAAAVDETLQLGRAATDSPRVLLSVGVDLGFVRDAAAACAVERTPVAYSLLDYLERTPGTDRLKPSEVFAAFGELGSRYGATDVVADQNHAEAAREWFNENGFAFVDLPGGNAGKAEVYDVAWNAFAERQVRIPNDERLLEQLREVKKTPLPGGGYKIDSPRKPKGGHGDIVSAFVAGLWQLSRVELPPEPKRVESPRWEKALADLRPDPRRTVWDRIGKRMR